VWFWLGGWIRLSLAVARAVDAMGCASGEWRELVLGFRFGRMAWVLVSERGEGLWVVGLERDKIRGMGGFSVMILVFGMGGDWSSGENKGGGGGMGGR